ncbi:MAG: hypothetical protein IKN72_03720 [Clostridia bacterium]|nr:hypothetical protein [Clostridia bacterium]
MNIYQDVLQRLSAFGLNVFAENDPDVLFAIGRAEEQILNDINCSEIPKGLKYVFIDLAVGLFLSDQKACGQLRLGAINFDAAPAKSIKEGDVEVTFASASDGSLTPEARFDALLDRLTHPSPGQLARYRRLAW